MARASSKSVSYRMEPPSWLELTTSADRALEISNASGAAIALLSDIPGKILCCARSGSIAPELGIASLLEESVTGRCIRSGKQLLCNDAQADPLACSSAAADLDARSLVATPIQQGARTIGVLAVFSTAPGAFSSTHLTELRTIADKITRILENQGVPAATKSKPPQPARLPHSGREAGWQPPPEHRVELESAQLANPLPQIPMASIDRFPTLEAAAGRKREPAIISVLLTVTVVLLVVTGSATWAYLKRTGAASVDSDTSPEPAQRAFTLPDKIAPKFDDPAPAETPAPNLGTAQQGPTRTVSNPEAALDKRPLSLGSRKQSVLPPVATSDSPGASSDSEAPQLTVAGSTDLPLIALSKAAAPKPAPAFASGLVPARLIRHVPPQYPKIARDLRVSGTVTVRATIKKDGTLTDLELVSGPPLLRQAAFDAIRQWEYAPATLNGQVIEQVLQIKLLFSPNAK